MKPKKADLSITVIIAAVIGLVALVVIIAIFVNTTQKTSENIGSCTTKDGTCASTVTDPDTGELIAYCPSGYIKLLVSGDCKSSKNTCCIKPTN